MVVVQDRGCTDLEGAEMAAGSAGTPVRFDHIDTAIDGQRNSASRWIPILLWLATGSAGTLWILAQCDERVGGDEPIWLFIIVTLTAWPSYLAWRFCSKVRDQLQDHGEGAVYSRGYGDGYLQAMADRLNGPEPQNRARQ